MNAFSFEKFLAAISKYRVTSVICVPPIVVQIAKNPAARKTDFSSIREIWCGAAPLGADVQQQAERVMDPSGRLKIQQVWGMSEATVVVTSFPLGEIDPDISGVGYLRANLEAKIVDDSGKELGYDAPGEIYVRGPNIFPGYWKKEKATRDSFDPEGFYKTGDVAMMKKSTGIIHIVDRKKELIKVKGMYAMNSRFSFDLSYLYRISSRPCGTGGASPSESRRQRRCCNWYPGVSLILRFVFCRSNTLAFAVKGPNIPGHMLSVRGPR